MSKQVTETRDEETNKTIRTTIEDKPETWFSPAERKTTVEEVTPGWICDSTKVISTSTTRRYD